MRRKRFRVRRVWLGGLLLAIGWAPTLWAAPDGFVAMTSLEAGALGRARLVVLADVVEGRSVRGQVLLQLAVREVYKGEAEDRIPVFVGAAGRRPGTEPLFDPGDRGRHVFFLVADGDGDAVAYRLDTSFLVEGTVGIEKVQVLAAEARLAQRPPGPDRRAQVVAHLLDGLAAEGLWTRVHASRELHHAAGVRPDAFDAAARGRLREAARKATAPEVRRWLGDALARIDLHRTAPEAPSPAGAALPPRPDGQTDEERLAVIAAWLADEGALEPVLARWSQETPGVRAGVVDLLAARTEREALPDLLAAYASENDPEVARALVRGAGLLGDASTVPWLAARLDNASTRREALFALARIRTVPALRALRAVPSRMEERHEPIGDIRPLLSYLLGRAFEESERAAGRLVGPDRWRSSRSRAAGPDHGRGR